MQVPVKYLNNPFYAMGCFTFEREKNVHVVRWRLRGFTACTSLHGLCFVCWKLACMEYLRLITHSVVLSNGNKVHMQIIATNKERPGGRMAKIPNNFLHSLHKVKGYDGTSHWSFQGDICCLPLCFYSPISEK